MTIEEVFFELLQVAIGTRKSLSVTPSAEQWTELLALAKKQALVGIAFAGVTRLNVASDYGASLGMDEMTYLKWLGLMAKIQQRNKTVSQDCVRLAKDLAHDGMSCCVLKGQSNLVYYPEDLRECRTSGDIDVLIRPADDAGIEIAVADLDGKGAHYERYAGIRGSIEYVRMQCRLHDVPVGKICYHHLDMPTDFETSVEAHHRATWLNSPIRNWRLQRWLEENMPFGVCDADFTHWENLSRAKSKETPLCKKRGDSSTDGAARAEGKLAYTMPTCSLWRALSNHDGRSRKAITGSGPLIDKNVEILDGFTNHRATFPIPTVSFKAVYQLLHIYKHLFEEGIGLRHLLDYYFVLRALHIEQGTLADRTESMAQWAVGMGIAVASNEEIMHTLGSFGMKKFAGAVMYVLQTVFAMPDEYLICQPNEKGGKFLLNEIMQAGNFGKYDDRIKHGGTKSQHAWEKTKHNLRLLTHYPEEVICEPFFRVYHWIWRKFELWRY